MSLRQFHQGVAPFGCIRNRLSDRPTSVIMGIHSEDA